MADIPGQIEHLVEEDRLTRPVWYEWFLGLQRFVTNATAWTSFTPIVTPSTGSLTHTSSGRYRRTGRIINVNYDVLINSVGTGTGYVSATLPVAPSVINATLLGREIAITGNMTAGIIAAAGSTATFAYYNNTTTLANGTRVVVSGTYEV